MKFAIIRTGGKQYFVKENDEILVDHLKQEQGKEVVFDTLATGDAEKNNIELGAPLMKTNVKGLVIENLKGDKLRVARFKAKSRSRRVVGFRHTLSRVKITNI